MRIRPIGLLLSGVVAASSACSMDATAPSSLAAPESAALARGGKQAAVGVRSVHDRFAGATVTTYTVTIDPRRRNLLSFGPHTLDVPAQAICGTASGYGLDSFGLNCGAATSPVTITAKLRSTSAGVPRIDLTPELRFSPRRTVTLRLYVPNLARGSFTGRILYCPTETMDRCVDEAVIDPSLETHVNHRESTLFRRIKHFSGYFVES